ncbi:hypothetical protein GWI33_006729 [Rhynchophorus ferrugineus]|uniref:mRNA export factor GLE1 n=1 Tax=Rhynchophorus ferrugineus TaxID=354439 RepID=A0A834MCQ2_RHYFE|nr:hypothetical protein GWI33_006729 [Rhynchophorus ferrugineus]
MLESLVMEADKFKSIAQKLRIVNPLVNEVTIGPNSINNRESVSPKESLTKGFNENCKVCDVDTIMVNQMSTMKLLKVLDPQRQEQVQNALSNRLSMFKQFDELQKVQRMEHWQRTKQDLVENVEKTESNILQASEQFDIKQSNQQALISQQTKIAFLRMREKQEQLREQERQKKKILQQIDQIKKNQHTFYIEWTELIEILKGIDNLNSFLVRNSGKFDLTSFQTMPSEMGSILDKCKIKNDNSFNLSEEDVHRSEDILTKIVDFKTVIKKIISEEAQNTIKPEESSKDNAQLKSDVIQPPVSDVVKPSELTDEVKEKIIDNKTNEDSNYNKLTKYINLNDVQLYSEIMDFLEKYKESFAQLENDSSLKNFRFDLKKAVNIPVNSLSDLSPDHITDKYQKLHKLLIGETVIISNQQVNAARHPQGIAFCMDLLAKKFILQDFGKLILGYFYKLCPYLVPYYIPKQLGDSDEEFYKKLGYQYTDGEIEKQDKFLKRMTGIMKLYFALLVTKPKKTQPSSPYNLQRGWKWLSSFLRLQPQTDITATALHTFLETVGFEMDARYGKIFKKVLRAIIEEFLPKCQKTYCTGGAATRLEMLLTKYLETKNFNKPTGYEKYLTDASW